MDIMQIATQLLTQQFKDKVSADNVKTALSGLMGDGKGGLDISGIVSKLSSSGNMAGMMSSWLGDGDNDNIEADQITEVFGADKITSFAKNLGVDEKSASSGLAAVLPNLIDKSSSGGNLLSGVGDIGGALNMAKKLF